MEGLRDAGFYGVDVLKEQIRELDELEDTKKDSVKAVFFCAPGGNRTRTAVSGQGILSPSCLPFHHQGVMWECKGSVFLRKSQIWEREVVKVSKNG